MQIRPAHKKDLVQLEELFSLPELMLPNGKFMSAELLSHYLDDDFFLVIENEDEILGAIFGEQIKYEGMMLWDFAVKKSYQGKGVGKMLLEEFEKNTRSRGLTWIIGYVPERNPSSVQFYKKRGYAMEGETYIEFLKELDN